VLHAVEVLIGVVGLALAHALLGEDIEVFNRLHDKGRGLDGRAFVKQGRLAFRIRANVPGGVLKVGRLKGERWED
jgi:hypothetical protein